MERQILCAQSDNQMIKDLSAALQERGVTEGADSYFEADEYDMPYFKIPKKFKRETENDPETCYLFVDISDEYTVHGRYIHEHLPTAESAAKLVCGLLTGEIVEVALVFPNKMAAFFLKNTGNPEKNVHVIEENAEYVMEHLNSPMAQSMNFHGHLLFEASWPYNLWVGACRPLQIDGVQIYMLSSVFGEHAEYYILK